MIDKQDIENLKKSMLNNVKNPFENTEELANEWNREQLQERKPKYHIVARHINSNEYKDLFYYSVKQAKFFNPQFTDFKIVGVDDEVNEKIVFNKNKLVLLTKLFKDVKNKKVEQGDEETAYKYRLQRRVLETLLQDDGVDKLIDKMKTQYEDND
jgi:hypothetical protein